MKVSSVQYQKMVEKASPNSPSLKNFFFAFVIGGGICALAQLILEGYFAMGIPQETAKGLVSVTLIFLAALFTGLNVFDRLAKVAGAGTLVPITGFANSIASPAMEFKNEGQILGVGAKMFSIAGPVLVFGISASVLYGIILWLVGMFG